MAMWVESVRLGHDTSCRVVFPTERLDKVV
jgi:hypothetical protein